MKVITLDEKSFEIACLHLADEIVKDVRPVALVGIVTGGAIVARQVHKRLLRDIPELKYFELSASRSSTVTKQKINIKYLFSVMPSFVLNYTYIGTPCIKIYYES